MQLSMKRNQSTNGGLLKSSRLHVGSSHMSHATYNGAVEIITDIGLELEEGDLKDLPEVPQGAA